LGTDTGGSIRQPASFCGVVGIKPTYGRISRYGIVSYASSLDQAGPITSTVEDAALMLEAMCGPDEKDQTTAQIAVPRFADRLSPNMKSVRVGILKEFMQEAAMHPDTLATVRRAVEVLKSEGAEITEVSVPLTSAAVPVYYLVASSEASSNLSRYDGVRYGYRAHFANLAGVPLDEFYMKTRAEGFGSEVKRRIMLGTFCLSSGYYDAYYNKACQVRRLMKDQFTAALQKCDVIISPVTTHPAFELGGRVADPLAMYLNDIYTVSTNLAGLPGMSVPFGVSKEGLPIGVQLQAGHFEEQKLLNVGFALEKAADLNGKVPRVY
jgi:aspartyl-tRNA(Asn)/glutamyl-tRNA(Gln) amidotransferase subunit A